MPLHSLQAKWTREDEDGTAGPALPPEAGGAAPEHPAVRQPHSLLALSYEWLFTQHSLGITSVVLNTSQQKLPRLGSLLQALGNWC